MAKSNTRKYLIYGSIAAIVGVIGYYIWKSSKKDDKPKDETPALDNDGNEKDGKVNETPVKDKGNVGTPATAPTQEKIDLAKAYRTWANSTDALSLKWGKKSKYDLDATRTDPYGGTFLTSYNDGGKAEYEAFLKGSSAGANQIATNKKNMDALIEAWYGNSAAKKYSDTGRSLQIQFDPAQSWNDPYFWQINFYGNTNGKSSPTYSISDGSNKRVGTGYWLFSQGAGYKLTASSGIGKREQPYRGTQFNAVLKAIIGREITWKK